MTDTLTILKSPHPIEKTFHGASLERQPFKMARFFDVAEITVHDLNSLAEALFSIEKQSDKAVIRGSLHKDRWPPLQLPRTKETFNPRPGNGACLMLTV